MPVISITGVFGVKPAERDALLMVSATAAAAASPTVPHFSQIRNTTGSPAPCSCAQAMNPSGETVDHVIGAERLVAVEQRLQHAAAYGREARGTRGADRLGLRQRVAGTEAVIVAGSRKDRPLR
jgi:hypothetical protein